jgi:hypothetical protein
MSDKTTPEPIQVEGQPQEEEKGQFLTREEYHAGQEKLLNALKVSNKGLAGSMGETQGKRISADIGLQIQDEFQQLRNSIEALKAVGGTVTPEQERAMKQRVIEEAFTKKPNETQLAPDQTPRRAPAQEPEEETDPITQDAWELMDEMGIDLLDDDPEVEMIDDSTPRQFFKTLEKALEAKRQRISQTSEEPNQTVPPQARIPGAGAGGSTGSLLPDGTQPLERLQNYYSKK